MISGGRILWNAIAICERSKTSWQTGKLRMNEDPGNHSKGPIILFDALVQQLPNSERQTWNSPIRKESITRNLSKICFDRGGEFGKETFCKSGKRRKTGASALCTKDDASCFLFDKTSVYEMNVTVMSTVTGCDVTTVQQHYKGSASTPPRVARLCQIREASLVALRKFPKIYACSHVSII